VVDGETAREQQEELEPPRLRHGPQGLDDLARDRGARGLALGREQVAAQGLDAAPARARRPRSSSRPASAIEVQSWLTMLARIAALRVRRLRLRPPAPRRKGVDGAVPVSVAGSE
jgi:hypothetical protein